MDDKHYCDMHFEKIYSLEIGYPLQVVIGKCNGCGMIITWDNTKKEPVIIKAGVRTCSQ
jgi:hypothetical protein